MQVSKQFVPQVPGGFFHDLWFGAVNWRIQTGCSTGAWWIFPRPVVFLARKTVDYVDSKRFKRKRKYKRRDMGKRLEERERDLSNEERGGNIKGERSQRKTSSSCS